VATSKGKESTRFKSDAEKYRDQMQKFQESEACFSRFRNTNGSVKDGAFQECGDIKRPPPARTDWTEGKEGQLFSDEPCMPCFSADFTGYLLDLIRNTAGRCKLLKTPTG